MKKARTNSLLHSSARMNKPLFPFLSFGFVPAFLLLLMFLLSSPAQAQYGNEEELKKQVTDLSPPLTTTMIREEIIDEVKKCFSYI